VPTDEEIVYVGYDATRAPTHIWTRWPGRVLNADRTDRGQVAIDVQWESAGPCTAGSRDLPAWKKLNLFYTFVWIGFPDTWLGTERAAARRAFVVATRDTGIARS
jgi:hypothetical protein